MGVALGPEIGVSGMTGSADAIAAGALEDTLAGVELADGVSGLADAGAGIVPETDVFWAEGRVTGGAETWTSTRWVMFCSQAHKPRMSKQARGSTDFRAGFMKDLRMSCLEALSPQEVRDLPISTVPCPCPFHTARHRDCRDGGGRRFLYSSGGKRDTLLRQRRSRD